MLAGCNKLGPGFSQAVLGQRTVDPGAYLDTLASREGMKAQSFTSDPGPVPALSSL